MSTADASYVRASRLRGDIYDFDLPVLANASADVLFEPADIHALPDDEDAITLTQIELVVRQVAHDRRLLAPHVR